MLSLNQYNEGISSHFFKDLKIYGFSVYETGDFRLLAGKREAVVDFKNFLITSYLNFYIRLPKFSNFDTSVGYFISLN